MKYEARIPFILSWKFIQRSNKWTLVLIVFFMSIAFVNMIFITSLFNGIVEGFNRQIIDTSTGHIFITPHNGNDVIAESSQALDSIKKYPEVVGASAKMHVPGSLEWEGKKGSWGIDAIDPDDEQSVTVVHERMVEGSYLEPGDTDQIILGSVITDYGADTDNENPFSLRGVSIGDTVTINFGASKHDFAVKGIFKTKFIDTDDKAFITRNAFESINPYYQDEATSITVRLKESASEKKIAKEFKSRGVAGNIYTWEEASSLMDSISDSFLSINVIMSAVGILIAAITVFIVIYIDINTKRKQIGILRAIGIKPYIIRATYVIITSVYSIFGILIGSAIFFGILMPYFNAHPFELPIADATLSVNYADFIGRLQILIWVAIGAGLIPSIHATRIKLLDAIWGH